MNPRSPKAWPFALLAVCILADCKSSSGTSPPGGSGGLIEDAELSAYLQSVGEAVADEAGEDPFPIDVYDFDAAQAFALPTRRVALTRGMLLLISSEAELACVLGHEIAHHLLGHVSERFAEQDPPPLDMSHPLFNGWPEEEEAAADLRGLELCAGAGYEPLSAPNLLLSAARFDSELSFEQLSNEDDDEPHPLVIRTRDAVGRISEVRVEGLRRGVPEYLRIRDRALGTGGMAEARVPQDARRFFPSPILVGGAYLAFDYYTQLERDGREATVAWIQDQCMPADNTVVPSNYLDAFGHCWSGCQVSRDCGSLCGNPGIWHEIGREFFYGGEHDSFWQDWRNQNEGARRSGGEGSCYGICEDAIESGELDLTAPYRRWWGCDEGGLLDGGRPNGSTFNRYGDTVSPRFFGDPHLVTADGLRYDFHGVGEFIALHSVTDDFVVQARFAPVAALRASKTSAVAMNVEGDRVGAYLTPGGISVRVNGDLAEQSASWVTLPGGGRIQVDSTRLIAQWADDTTLWAYGFGDVIDVSMRITPPRLTRLRGLLGDADGDLSNEYVTRDGVLIDVPTESGETRRQALYDDFGETWRIIPEESLFDYLAGDSSEDYQQPGFPDTMIAIDDLGGSERAIAEDRCRQAGVTESPWLEECIFDMGFTGDPEWAESARRTSDPSSLTWNEMYQAQGDIVGPQTVTMEEFLAKAGQRHFFRILQNMPSLNLAQWELFAPSGTRVFRACVVSCNQPGEYELAESGLYTSRLTADPGESGTLVVARNLVPDPQVFDQGDDDVLGSALGTGAGMIEVPGSVDIYRIDGASGTRLTFSFLERNPQLFFGRWQLVDPGGVTLFDAIFPSVGTPQNVDLVTNGTYLLRVDGGDDWPSDEIRGYGEYSILLSVAPSP